MDDTTSKCQVARSKCQVSKRQKRVNERKRISNSKEGGLSAALWYLRLLSLSSSFLNGLFEAFLFFIPITTTQHNTTQTLSQPKISLSLSLSKNAGIALSLRRVPRLPGGHCQIKPLLFLLHQLRSGESPILRPQKGGLRILRSQAVGIAPSSPLERQEVEGCRRVCFRGVRKWNRCEVVRLWSAHHRSRRRRPRSCASRRWEGN